MNEFTIQEMYNEHNDCELPDDVEAFIREYGTRGLCIYMFEVGKASGFDDGYEAKEDDMKSIAPEFHQAAIKKYFGITVPYQMFKVEQIAIL